MTLIDTNTLLLLILGNIDPGLISKNNRTSIFSESDYYNLQSILGDLAIVIVINEALQSFHITDNALLKHLF